MKKVPEPDASLLNAEDVDGDVLALTEMLRRRSAEREAYDLINRPRVRRMLKRLVGSGVCRNREEAIERALRVLVAAVEK